MAGRSIAIQLIVLVANVYLYRTLQPADFGVFAIVQFVIAFFALFGDAGLAAAIIQSKQEPTDRELSSIWTLQLLVGGAATLFLTLLAPYVLSLWPTMPESGPWILRCVALAFLFTLSRAIPTVLLERRLAYGRLAALEVLLTLGFYVPAIALAGRGIGALSLGIGLVVQATLGMIGAFMLNPWKPGFVLDRAILAPIVRFGLAFQSKNLFGFATAAVAPVLGGGALGQSALGQIGWAQSTGFFPLRLTEIVARIGFPLYSRLQHDRVALTEAVERSIHVCALGTFLYLSIVFGLGEPLVQVVFGERWLPALPLLYVYTAAISVGFLTPLLMPALDALGHPAANMRLAALTMVLIWSLVPIGVWLGSTLGFAVGYAAVVFLGNFAMCVVSKRFLPEVRLLRQFVGPVVTAVTSGLVARVLLADWVSGPWRLAAAVVATLTIFTTCTLLIDRRARTDVLSTLRRASRGRNAH